MQDEMEQLTHKLTTSTTKLSALKMQHEQVQQNNKETHESLDTLSTQKLNLTTKIAALEDTVSTVQKEQGKLYFLDFFDFPI